ncbi:uncharacterized protein LOC120166612 [Hibiscus syriacus]|uniref:uncharacterized protein LOC120166612 n=1 Tax=Hibiscus syriacus TaxID=106335 RepID=UPI0019218B90|nr:uncharacterized protein LOC120166612 [Hibiscus syriacus]
MVCLWGFSFAWLADEETGWYDGQIWVKTAEVLARDRLLGSFTVKPVLIKLKYTLVTLAASSLVCVLPLLSLDQGGQEGSYMTSKETQARAIPEFTMTILQDCLSLMHSVVT